MKRRADLIVLLAVVGGLATGAGVLRFFVAGGSLQPAAATAGNEQAALEALEAVATLEKLWKEGDADGNGVNDWWTADWSGFRRALGRNGRPVNMMAGALAAADAAPLPPSPRLAPALPAAPHLGYWFRALPVKDGWAFAAAPAEPGRSGVRTFIVREGGRVWARAGAGDVRAWPADTDAALRDAGWAPAR